MSKTKKAGCTNYAEVSDDYMLYKEKQIENVDVKPIM